MILFVLFLPLLPVVEACIEMLLKDEDETADDCPKLLPVRSENSWDMVLLNSESSQNAMLQQPLPAASTGAIKKISAQQPSANQSLSFASFMQQGSTPQGFGSLPQPQRSSNMTRRGDKWPSNFDSAVDLINQGYRVMVLMRGAPGSGKSYLSRALVDRTLGNGDYRNHVFSADDYFIVNGAYRYQADRIEDAHRFNQNNVRAKARDGWSPIVVDNTHMRLWEMYAYVQIAAENGYYLEVLEPVTHWRLNARSLASRNAHGVPEQKIKSMLMNYEKLKDTAELYKQCKLEHALYFHPKIRHFPILQQDLQLNIDENQNSCQVSLLSIPYLCHPF